MGPAATKHAQATAGNGTPGVVGRVDSGLRGLMKAAALASSGQAAATREGIKAEFALQIDAAYRSGMNKDQIAQIVRSIKQAMQASLRAAAERAGADLTGRMSETMAMHRGKGRPSTKGGQKLRT